MAALAVTACRNMQWTPFHVGARRSSRMRFFAATEANHALMVQQHAEQQGLLAATRAAAGAGTERRSLRDLRDDFEFTNSCKRLQGLRALTAQQALDWPVCIQRD